MNRKLYRLFVCLSLAIAIGVVSTFVGTASVFAEQIDNFNTHLEVQKDGTLHVVETIIYNPQGESHHGILRDIVLKNANGGSVNILGISVTDEQGTPYMFSTSGSGSIDLKIGDPNVTFSDPKTYVIGYTLKNAYSFYKDFDEIYWNITGNSWPFSIAQASAGVVLPDGTSVLQSACYFGAQGSKNNCQAVTQGSSVSFVVPGILNSGDGFTVAVGFPKGVVPVPSTSDKVFSFFEMYWTWFLSGILPILTLIFSLVFWYRKGRDDRTIGVIVPQYDVVDGLTPMEVGGIVNEKVNAKNISAEIIYLATKGYLKIQQLEERFIGFIKTTDYELIKLKDFSDLPNGFDQKLLNALFGTPSIMKLSDLKNLFFKDVSSVVTSEPNAVKSSVKLSDLKNVFYRDAAAVVTSVLDALLNKGYYKNLGRMKNGEGRVAIILFMSVWASVFFGGIIGAVVLRDNLLPMMAGIFLSIIIYAIVSHFNPAKTGKGVAAKEYLLGLKNYLQIAEKDRLQFHNAPEKKPEVFEKLLPYAMVLGVANIWAKEFEGIYTTPPLWYSGPTGTAFGAVAFSHSMSSFSSFASSSLSSSPGGGGGSGGGGSSGGGGGGGGGGSW